MRRFISQWLDDYSLPLLKAAYPGWQQRLAPYRPVGVCRISGSGNGVAPPDMTREAEPSWRGFEVERYRFASPAISDYPENRFVCGRLLYAGRRAPWVVVVPGYATGAMPPHSYGLFQSLQGLALLRRGLNVALIDLPYHMTRTPHGFFSGERFFTPDLASIAEAIEQSLTDLISLIRWLQATFASPVALWGTSLGGCVSALAATQLPELAAVGLMEPLNNPGDVIATLPAGWHIRHILDLAGLHADDLKAMLSPVAPSSYRPALHPSRILIATPRWDHVVAARFQDGLWQAWGKPQRIVLAAGHITMTMNRPLNTLMADFLGHWLRLSG
ncbi:MAG: alpha/beta hydrolase [Mycobacterium leprae]